MITEDKKLSKEFHRILCNYVSVHDVNLYLQKQPINQQKPPKNKKQKRKKRKRKKKSEETQ